MELDLAGNFMAIRDGPIIVDGLPTALIYARKEPIVVAISFVPETIAVSAPGADFSRAGPGMGRYAAEILSELFSEIPLLLSESALLRWRRRRVPPG